MIITNEASSSVRLYTWQRRSVMMLFPEVGDWRIKIILVTGNLVCTIRFVLTMN